MKNELKPFDKVLVRDSVHDCWEIDFFSYTNVVSQNHQIEEGTPMFTSLIQYVCANGSWFQIIKYTPKLDFYIGTQNQIPGALGQ